MICKLKMKENIVLCVDYINFLKSQANEKKGKYNECIRISKADFWVRSFPRRVPFSSMVPLTCADLKRSIDQFYSFAVTKSGQPVTSYIDTIVQEVSPFKEV
jgi:hypothetical protein